MKTIYIFFLLFYVGFSLKNYDNFRFLNNVLQKINEKTENQNENENLDIYNPKNLDPENLTVESLSSDIAELEKVYIENFNTVGFRIQNNSFIFDRDTMIKFGQNTLKAEEFAKLIQFNQKLLAKCGESLANCQIKDNEKIDLNLLGEEEGDDNNIKFKEIDQNDLNLDNTEKIDKDEENLIEKEVAQLL